MPLNELFTRLADFNEDNNKVSQAKRTGDTSKLTTTQRDQLRQPGTNAVLNGKEVKWGGQNYGWQSPESFKKLEQGPEFRAGHIAHTRINTDVNSAISSLLTPVVKAIGEDNIKTAVDTVSTVHETALKYVPQYKQTATALKIGLNNLEKVNESVSKATNVSPLITGEILTEAATLGGGKALKIGNKVVNTGLDALTASGRAAINAPRPPKRFGGHRSIPKGEVGAVTAKNPEILNLVGVKHGDDIVSREQAKHLTRRALEVQERVDKLPVMRDQLNEMIESGADLTKIKRFRATIDDTKAMLHRKRSNVSVPTKEDPLWYQTTAGKAAKRQEEIARSLKAGEYLEAHHLFPKVVSSAFFDRMDWMINKGLAEADDLVLMNEIAIKLGRKPGDYKSGMLNITRKPHNELHTVMDLVKDEFNEAEWAAKVGKTKTVDDLLVLWRDTINDNIIPNAKHAESIDKLDDVVKSVSPQFTGEAKVTKESLKGLTIK
jgi:hypothetical protein